MFMSLKVTSLVCCTADSREPSAGNQLVVLIRLKIGRIQSLHEIPQSILHTACFKQLVKVILLFFFKQ